MLYQAYQIHSDAGSPLRLIAQIGSAALGSTDGLPAFFRQIPAALEVFSRMRLTHSRPSYAIDAVRVGDEQVPVTEQVVQTLAFGQLIHFQKALGVGAENQPKVLLVAPLSGHFATLLRETVRTLLQDHDVFITDWFNARDVPLAHGAFTLDDYIDHMIAFTEKVGTDAHWVAVCQPCVAALAATAIMAEDDNPYQPRSLTLMAGPVDCRVNPTALNTLAISKSLDWFEKNLISHVPLPHAGFMRRVYPGFVQLSAFMSMNPDRHKQAFRDLYQHLVDGDLERAQTIRNFYEEYLAVNDLPAEFYLETIGKVFQTFDLAMGKFVYRGRIVNTRAIRRTALMTVEGERDDICAVGQTVAAQDLCTSIRPYLRNHHVQTGVGHYGVFSGRKWNQQIYPRVRDSIYASQG